MAEFPREELTEIARDLDRLGMWRLGTAVWQAIKSHNELADRCVMDATEASLEIARLRDKIAELENR